MSTTENYLFGPGQMVITDHQGNVLYSGKSAGFTMEVEVDKCERRELAHGSITLGVSHDSGLRAHLDALRAFSEARIAHAAIVGEWRRRGAYHRNLVCPARLLAAVGWGPPWRHKRMSPPVRRRSRK